MLPTYPVLFSQPIGNQQLIFLGLDIVLRENYWLSTGYKLIAQHTAQNFETPNCRKIDNGNLNNSANTDIYAYSETTFRVPTVGYGMTEN